jgi:hypothetical protein
MLRSLMFSAVIFALGVTTAQADTIAKVVASTGTATASGKALGAGSDIAEHDKITVGAGGNVQLLFTDGTKLVVGPNSTLVIEKYLMQGGGTAKDVSVDALRGTFRFITGRSAKSAYDIKTANSTIGIRGTGFDFWVDGRTGVVVLQGKVRLCTAKSCVDIEPNCHAGLTEAGVARPLRAYTLSSVIRNHLPYVVDQSRLKPDFWLPITACERTLTLTEAQQGGAKDKPACRVGVKGC